MKCIFLFLFFIFTSGFAQQEPKTILFEVYEIGNEAFPGVSILEKGTENGTQTDLNGKAKLEVINTKSKIEISFLGPYLEIDLIKKDIDLIKVYLAERKTEYYKNGKRIKKKRLKY